MSEPAFRPLVREDGRLDPATFEHMGEAWIERWLRERLSGSDPYFPIDTRSDEDSEAFVVGLLREAGYSHPAVAAIGRAILTLLSEARRHPLPPPPYLPSLLRLCQKVHLELTFSWFREQLEAIARDSATARERWGGLRAVREILFAAVVQAPARTSGAALEAWSTLLRAPEFSSMALAALGTSLEQKLPYLAEWWRHCSPERRDRELSYMVGRAIERDEVPAYPQIRTPPLPLDLREALEREFRAQGAPILVERSPRQSEAVPSALIKAGLRREYLLDQQAA